MADDDINNDIKEVTKSTVKYEEPAWENNLVYDSPVETLEPVYFWVLDFMEGIGLKTEKIVDNFSASPGSGHFGDLTQRASNMQDRGMTILKLIGARDGMIANVMSLINDLKVREMKLKDYSDSRSKDELIKEAGLLAIKRRWVDEVDVRKGRGSLLNMNQQAFPGILDAFHIINSVEEIDKLDLNDQVKRLLKPRMKEFLDWKQKSEEVERKYYQIEKGHLKNQVNSIRLYAKWVKPYLIAAEKLSMKQSKSSALVNVFDTVILELCLLGVDKLDVEKEVIAKDLPPRFKKLKMRTYHPCVFVDLKFRGIPTKRTQGTARYSFGGRVDVKFRAYALNDDELALLRAKFEDDEMQYVLGITEGIDETGLAELKDDIDYYLKSEETKIKEDAEKKRKEKSANDINPFFALFSIITDLFPKRKKEEKSKDAKEAEAAKEKEKVRKLREEGIKKDSYEEGVVRKLAEGKAKEACFNIFDKYKKAHGMATFLNPFESGQA